MAWIETTTGYVNLATARRIVDAEDRGHLIIDQDGYKCRVDAAVSNKIENVLSPVVPDTRGSLLHRICYEANDTPDTYVITFPIVAWRVDALCGAIPVVPGDWMSLDREHSMVVIELPDGSCLPVGGEVIYGSLGDAETALAERCRQVASGLSRKG